MPLSEFETRANFIDQLLRTAGWNVDNPTQVRREWRVTARHQTGEASATYEADEFADYVLFRRDGKPLAVVEAKRSSRDPLVGERQAEDYAHALEAEYGVSPVAFLTNGTQIWLLDRGRFPVRGVVKVEMMQKRRAAAHTWETFVDGVGVDSNNARRP